jgi:chemotaxis protein histidine kinase CheA
MGGKIDLSRFREKFVREARERLARMEEAFAFLEGSPGDSRVEGDVLREAHTLKGASRMMGFRQVARLAHELEEAVTRRRERKIPPTPSLFEAVRGALAVLESLVSSVEAGGGDDGDVEAAAEALRVALPHTAAAAALPGGDGAPPPPPSSPPPVAAPPVPGAPPPIPGPDAPSFVRRGELGKGEIRVEQGRLDSITNLITNATGTHLRRLEVTGRIAGTDRHRSRLTATLVSLLEDGLVRGLLEPAFAARVERVLAGERKALREAAELTSALRRKEDELSGTLGQLLDDLRSEFLAVRMVPLSPVFDLFRESVSELSRSLGKEVELVVRGGKTEIDRKVAEAVTDPLIHLLRNALDHGIEAPEVRAARGKAPKGRLVVSATPKKGRVVIEVEDDGKGIDLREVRDAAVRKGLVSEKASYRLDEREILSFIFRTGFSTARAMTDISGRGIGMDVVRTVAERFNGSVDIQTQVGKGTKVTLELPLSMAVSRVLLFEVDGQPFGVPVMHAEGVHSVAADLVSVVEGRRSVLLDGVPVPVVWLPSLLDLREPAPPSPGERLLLLVLRHSQRKVAFVVDSVSGEAEVVVRGLGNYLGKVQLFMGSTILGTGEVALLLDVYDLLSAVRMRAESAPPQARPKAGVAGVRPASVLVVDEALLSRDVKARVLEAAGFEVETAPGAAVALALLARRPFDAVVAPSDLAGTDGAELAAKVRSAAPGTAVVLLVPPGDGEERVRAAAAGASVLDRDAFSPEALAPLLPPRGEGGGGA